MGYYKEHYARMKAQKAAGIPTRTIGGVEVESPVTLAEDSPWTAWLAALIDGEGHFDQTAAKITVNMCDRDILEKALACTGVGVITGPFPVRSPKHRPIWRWRVHRGADCWVLCHLMLPYLGERRTKEANNQCDLFRLGTAGKVIHGTRAYYKRGCRCEACWSANSDYQKERTRRT